MSNQFKLSWLTGYRTAIRALTILLGCVAVSGSLLADARLDAAARAACSNMRSCAMAEFDAMPADQRAQMQPMIDQIANTMCSGLDQISSSIAAQGEAGMVGLATACLESMATMNCSTFEDNNGTPECEKFEQATSGLR